MYKLTLVHLSALLFCATPLVSHGQMRSLPQPSKEAIWKSIVPKIKKHADEQHKILIDATKKISSDIIQTKSRSGIEKFISEATGLQSKGMRLTDPAGHRRWLRQLFEKHVIPVAEIRSAISSRSRMVDQSLAALDNKLIIDLKADVALDPSTIRCKSIDAALINREIDKVAARVYADVDEATAKSIAAFFAGTVGFTVGNQISRNAMADENGNVSWFGALVSAGIGIVADEVTSQVTNEVLGTKNDLRKSLNSLADRVIAGCIGEGNVAKAIVSEYTGSVQSHQAAVINALLKDLGVNRTWALQQF